MSEDKFENLLERCGPFMDAVHDHIGTLEPFPDQRSHVAFQSGLLTIEHATGVVSLANLGLLTSAIALMRPQFESLVRGLWLMHAASDLWISKLGEPLTVETAKRANEGPMLAEMFKELDASATSPKPIVAQLKEYRDVTWKALNSYTHGGLHPLSRIVTGYPMHLAYDVVRNANAITAIACQLLSILTGNHQAMGPVKNLHHDFADCLPIIGGLPSQAV